MVKIAELNDDEGGGDTLVVEKSEKLIQITTTQTVKIVTKSSEHRIV